MSDHEFLVLLTYDCNSQHQKVIDFLNSKGFERKSNRGRDLPRNTLLKKEWRSLNGNPHPSERDAYTESDKLSDKYRDMLKDFFNENDIDGHIYVLSAYEYTCADSVSGKANW
ncbi:MAG: hypothetical protein E7K90_21530 [Hafnia alvei]|uniref:hypothetical protein n=1 Tax=Hafnia alvei TaxID=569 RepID=UPI002906EF70|nr:hypothetical protein [Hafnia alvei]MDU7483947.1 hypothetical protein [Hafnia alvei]